MSIKKITTFAAAFMLTVGLLATLGATVYNVFSPGGALGGTWNSQTVNVGAGPSFILNQLPVTAGGTGLGTLTAHGVLLGEGTGNVSSVAAMAADTLLQGQGISADPASVSLLNCGDASHALAYSTVSHAFSCQLVTGSATGTVTSVGLALPSVFSVSGSPVTTSGTLTGTFASGQPPYSVLGTPAGTSGALSLVAASIDPDTPLPVPPTFVADDEFNGASIDTTGSRFTGATAWTALCLSTGSTSLTQGYNVFSPALTASRNQGGYSQPLAAGTFTYQAKLRFQNAQGNTLGGLFVGTASGGAGNMIVFGINSTTFIVQRLTNCTTFSANVFTSNANVIATPLSIIGVVTTEWVYLQIQYDGTNLRFSLSATGAAGTFLLVYSETAAGFLGTPGTIGFVTDNESATAQALEILDWFRRTA